jgi:hypothetical protein
MYDKCCPILVLFSSYSGPVAAMIANCWQCDALWVLFYSGLILVLFWSYCCCHDDHLKCDASWMLSYSGLILVLFWSYCCHDGPLKMWIITSDCPILVLFLVLFWSYNGLIQVIFWFLLLQLHNSNIDLNQMIDRLDKRQPKTKINPKYHWRNYQLSARRGQVRLFFSSRREYFSCFARCFAFSNDQAKPCINMQYVHVFDCILEFY